MAAMFKIPKECNVVLGKADGSVIIKSEKVNGLEFEVNGELSFNIALAALANIVLIHSFDMLSREEYNQLKSRIGDVMIYAEKEIIQRLPMLFSDTSESVLEKIKEIEDEI